MTNAKHTETRLERKLEAQAELEGQLIDLRLRRGDEFIVRAVNSHEVLVDAIERLINSYEYHCPEAKDKSNALKFAKEALKQAGEA